MLKKFNWNVTCTVCNKTKFRFEFKQPNYKKPVCIECRKKKKKEYAKEYRKKNKKKLKYASYKGSAKERNYEFNLTYEQFISFWQKPCTYCNSEIKTIGLDRIDNSKGYSIENVTPCCALCNSWKKALSKEAFINHAKKISNNN